MCQWKFLVFTYSANVSASNAVRDVERSLMALAPRSDGVLSGARRRSCTVMSFIADSFSNWAACSSVSQERTIAPAHVEKAMDPFGLLLVLNCRFLVVVVGTFGIPTRPPITSVSISNYVIG